MPKLTKTLIDNAPTPATGDSWLWDSELEGFGVRVQSSGRKTYVLRYRTRDASRTQRKMTLCRCSDAPPDKARQLARDAFMSVAAGNDPAAERKPNRDAATTVEAMFKARVAYMKAKGRANAGENERALLKARYNAADAFGRNTPAAEVTPDDVVKFVSKFYQAGHRGAADKARGYVAAAFAWAIKSANDYTVAERQSWGVTRNPAADVAKDPGAIRARDRNLDATEIRKLWDACHDGNGGFGEGIEAVLIMMIGCGQRVQETLRIEGREIDVEKALWKMPAEKTKGRKRAHTIPLPRVVLPTLVALKAKHGDGLLFPARTGSASEMIGLVSVSQAVRRWVSTEGNDIEAFQPRDLRRTWKSRAHDAGVDRFMRDILQQHAKNDTGSRVYDRSDYSPQMRIAMDRWNDWLTDVISGGDGKTTTVLKLVHDQNASHHGSGNSQGAISEKIFSGNSMQERAC